MAHLSENSYGKQRVRLTKVVRRGPQHEVHEYAVEIMLSGDFDAIYIDGENGTCVPTDTMKNTVYAVARRTEFDAPEIFARALARRFMTRYEQVQRVEISIAMERWQHIEIDGAPHPHAFVKGHGRRTARASLDSEREGIRVRGGITGMEVFKSGGSGFTGFHRDEYTLLRETDDRILATTVDAWWDYASGEMDGGDYNAVWGNSERIIAEVFAGHESPSLQATLYIMGERLLEEVQPVERVSFTMPNQHHVLFDLDRFDLDNPNEIFYGTDSPYGIITGTVSRSPEGGAR